MWRTIRRYRQHKFMRTDPTPEFMVHISSVSDSNPLSSSHCQIKITFVRYSGKTVVSNEKRRIDLFKHLSNYTNCRHNIYLFHIFTMFLLHVLVYHTTWRRTHVSLAQNQHLLRRCYIQSGPKKSIHTLTWKILLYNRNYCIYTKAKLIWEMSLNFGFNVGVRSCHNRRPNAFEAAELLQECIHFWGHSVYC